MYESCEEVVSEAEYAGVVFDIEETYSPGRDISCRFVYKSSFEAGSRDWIGVFIVGWTSPRDYCTYQWCSNAVKVNDSRGFNVVFPASSMPRQEEEFYQFCYVTGSGEFRGASYPFQIRKPYNPDDDIEICEYEDDEGMSLMVVKNKTAILEESLARAGEEMAALKINKESLKTENDSLKETILELESNKADLSCEVNALKNANMELVEKHKKERIEWQGNCESQQAEVRSKIEEVKFLEMSKEEVEKRLEKADAKILELNEMLQEEVQRKDETNKNKEKLVVEKMQFLQSMADDRKVIEDLRANIKKLQFELGAAKQESSKARDSNAVLNAQLDEMAACMRDKEAQLQAALKDSCDARAALRGTQAELDSSGERVKVLIGQLRRHESDNANIKRGLDEKTSELVQERKRCENLELEAEAFEKKMDNLVSQLQTREEEYEALEIEVENVRGEISAVLQTSETMKEEFENQLAMLHDQLEGQNALNNSLCLASDKQVSELQEQLKKQLQISADLAKKFERQSSASNTSEKELGDTKRELEIIQGNLQKANAELQVESSKAEELREEKEHLQKTAQGSSKSVRGSFMALQTAHAHMEKQLGAVKKERDDLWRQRNELKRQLSSYQRDLPENDLRHTVDELRGKVEDLRMRLRMGADAYKEKFMECNKLQTKLKKLQANKEEGAVQTVSFQAELMEKAQQDLADEKIMVQAMKDALECEKENSTKKMAQMEEAYMKVVNERATLQRKLEEILGGTIHLDQAAIQQAEDRATPQTREETEKLKKRSMELERTVVSLRQEMEETTKCLTDQIKQLQEKLTKTERDSAEVESLRQAHAASEVMLETLKETAASRIREYIENIKVLEAEVERWKKETQMHVNAAVEFVKKENAEDEGTHQTAEEIHPQQSQQQPPAVQPQQQTLQQQQQYEQQQQQQQQHYAQQQQEQARQGFNVPWPFSRIHHAWQPTRTVGDPWDWTYVHHQPNSPPHVGPLPTTPPPPPANPEMVPRGPDPVHPPPLAEAPHCCPVCRVYFPPSKQRELEDHVNRHFDEQ